MVAYLFGNYFKKLFNIYFLFQASFEKNSDYHFRNVAIIRRISTAPGPSALTFTGTPRTATPDGAPGQERR